jgi:hypothetical protein
VFDFLFPPEVVEFVSLVDRRLTFKCKKAYKSGQTVRVKVEVPTENGPQTLQLPVVVTSQRAIPGEKMRIAVSDVPAGSNQLAQIRQVMDNAAVAEKSDAGARRRTRHRLSLRLLSKDLPGFKALSVDYNALGLQIQTEGEIPVGKVLALNIELEGGNMPRVLCQGKVCWCQQVERKRFMIGVEFVNLPPQIEQELEDFEKLLLVRERGDIQAKTALGTVPLTDSEVYQGDGEARLLSINLPSSPPPPPAPPAQGISVL